MSLLPAGFRVGHWTDPVGRTGCTVILCESGATGGADVRGGAPGTLGTPFLDPVMRAPYVHAVLLTGGSAFGLAAADGVMRWLDERGIGLEIRTVRVPLVVGAVIFDLLVGDPKARPASANGYSACDVATDQPAEGAVGAGTGASVAKLRGDARKPGGLGIASATVNGATVTAVMVVNSVGAIWDDERHEWVASMPEGPAVDVMPGANTTIGAILTDATVTKAQAQRLAMIAHDGIAIAVRPAHTDADGDTTFALATGKVTVDIAELQASVADVVARAIVRGVRLSGDDQRSSKMGQ